MMSPDLNGVRWRKSSYSSGQNGNCVEVAHLGQLGAIRDSKNPTGPAIVVDLASFVAAAKSGTHDA